MNKEEILKLSQQENKGKPDERELNAMGKASRAGMAVGAILCVILVLVSNHILNRPELALAGWMIFFAMKGSSEFVLYSQLKDRTKLMFGIVDILFAIANAVTVFYIIMR